MAGGYVGYQGYDSERSKLDRTRQMAELLQQNVMSNQPQGIVSGLAGLGEAFIAKQAMDRADKAEAAYGDAQKQKYAQLAQTLSGTLPGDTPAISSGAKTTFGDAGEVTTTPGEMVTPAQASPQRRIFEALAASGQDPMAAYSVAQSMAPKPVEYSAVEFGTGGVGAFNPLTGKMNTLVEPTVKPTEDKPPNWQTTIIGNKVVAYNPQDPTQTRDMGPAPPKGEGGMLTPYQQWQMERQAEADAAKKQETDRQKEINVASLRDGMGRIDQFLGSKGFKGLYGSMFGIAKPENLMSQDEMNSLAMLNQIGGEAFLAGVAKMRGTGPLSDNEGKRVMAAVQRLTDRRQDVTSARAAAAEFKAAMQALIDVYERESGGAATPAAVQQPQAQPNVLDAAGQFIGNLFGGGRQGGQQPVRVNSPQERDALPSGTRYIAPDGSVKVKK